MEFDAADKAILYSLLRNARKPVSQLAKETKLTREVVQYRMRKLEEHGIIRGYVARIDMGYFCEGVASLVCRCDRTDEQRFEAGITYLKEHPAVNWCAELCGTADLVLTLLYRNPEHLAQTIADIAQNLRGVLREHQLSLFITEYKFDRRGVVHGREEPYRPDSQLSFRGKREASLDKVDLIVLRALAGDCRMTNVDIAAQAGVSEDTVRLRIQRLEKEGVIFGYTIVLDVAAYGLEAYYVRLQVEQMTDATHKKLLYYMNTNPYVGHCARTAGPYNVVLSLYAKDRKHFTGLLLDLRKHFGASLSGYEFQLNIKEHKETYLPEGLA